MGLKELVVVVMDDEGDFFCFCFIYLFILNFGMSVVVRLVLI